MSARIWKQSVLALGPAVGLFGNSTVLDSGLR